MKMAVTSILGFSALAVGMTNCQTLQNVSADAHKTAQTIFQQPIFQIEAGSIKARNEEPTLTRNIRLKDVALSTEVETHFGAFAGGGAPSYNEIALEKNLLYFQRSLTEKGFSPALAHLYFASGNAWEQTIRYLDENDEEQFKAAEIPNLDGGATLMNLYSWFDALAHSPKSCPSFFYFTGHGAYNPDNEDNNWLILWNEAFVSVKEFVDLLEPLPNDQPFVTMMAQCYSGSFTNLIYEEGDPEKPVALQTRCGFFATVASRPSVGCTPAVNEADYKDYSSSFFAGLTGRDRVGNAVPTADYNTDGTVSYAEAHAFAKVDEETTDWPISTVEAWLQRQISEAEVADILATPMDELSAIARPEQQYVITLLAEKIGLELTASYAENLKQVSIPDTNTIEEAYHVRLQMELTNIGAEQKLRQQNEPDQIAVLDKILRCEASTWK